VEIYKRDGSKFWFVDFVVNGKRFRKSTRATTKTRAMEVAAELIKAAQSSEDHPVPKGPSPVLKAFASEKFLPFLDSSQLDSDTTRYYKTGWRLLCESHIADWRMDRISTSDADMLQFPGTGSNANCALRTLRRMLSLALEWKLIQASPKIKLRKEKERSAVFTREREAAFLAVAPQPLKDVFLISQDSGLRPDEVIRMRWENVLWDKSLIFNPDGKTEKSRRHVPLSERVRDLLRKRAKGTASEWVFPSPRKRGAHISYFPVAKQFGKARKAAGLPDDIVLYSARHSFATDMLDRTGNIVLVQKMLGHESVTTTQRYLHPELKDIAELVNARNAEHADENLRHSLRHSRDTVQ
jgi:integrase